MNRHASGRYETTATGGETVRAFVPAPLPPVPPLDLGGQRQRLLERATLALGRLDSISTLLPDPQLFLTPMMPTSPSSTKEANRYETQDIRGVSES